MQSDKIHCKIHVNEHDLPKKQKVKARHDNS